MFYIMNEHLNTLMREWLSGVNGGGFHPYDNQRFYSFVLAVVKSGTTIEQNEYETIIEDCKRENPQLNDLYLERFDFSHFEMFCEISNYMLEAE